MSAVSEDIRVQLRRDHQVALAELAALRLEQDEHRGQARLAQLRRAWMVHALAEETVIYKALEAEEIAAGAKTGVDDRFAEHGEVEGHFERLSHNRPGTSEWHTRINLVSELIARHRDTEHRELVARIAERFGPEELAEMGERFVLTRDKLTLLENVKAA